MVGPRSHHRGVEEPSLKPSIAFRGFGTLLCSEVGGIKCSVSSRSQPYRFPMAIGPVTSSPHSLSNGFLVHLLVRPLSGERTVA